MSTREFLELDERVWNVKDEHAHYTLPRYRSREEWIGRAEYIKRHILICCGLWPIPERTPLNPRRFGRIMRGDYAVEKVYFESYPGFYVTGNLYIPIDGESSHPGVLCPHGHWKHGRLEDSTMCSVPGRCINLARQGYVVFSYDMVGYLDSFQVRHDFGSEETDALWGINLMGLQLWNSIRALDFLQSLDIVDPERIGCTGASGGGTQTFMLTAVDERVKVSAPVCMVSSHYQGGCLCENPPNLRIGISNVEIAAAAAPRPLLLISASGDWTRDNPVCEYPAIKRIYRLFNAEDKICCKHFAAGHNYNRESREAVYSWFGKWLLNVEREDVLEEKPFKVESIPDLLVFYGVEPPRNRVNSDELRRYMISRAKDVIEALRYGGLESLNRSLEAVREIYNHSLLPIKPEPGMVKSSVIEERWMGNVRMERLILCWRGMYIPAYKLERSGLNIKDGALLIHEDGKDALLNFDEGRMSPLVKAALDHRIILLIDCFATGEYLNLEGVRGRGRNIKFFTTYNRTDVAERVQDIITAAYYLIGTVPSGTVDVVGVGEAGLWSLLAGGFLDRHGSIVIDMNGFNPDDDMDWTCRLFIPLLRRAGGLSAAAALIAPSRLFIHNTQGLLSVEVPRRVYEAFNAASNLRIEEEEADVNEILKWIGIESSVH